MENKKEITEQDLIDACKYGYDYHKTTQFPNLEFEEFCKNNFRQLLESKKLEAVMALGDEDKLRDYVNKTHGEKTEQNCDKIEPHTRVVIPVDAVEFNADSHTIWVQGKEGGTTLRIKCTGKINTHTCKNSPLSHCDIMVNGDIDFCVSKDANI